MHKQYFVRALRCAAIALFLAAGLEVFKQVFFLNLPAWQLHITATLLCASIVFLLTLRLLWRGQIRSSLSTMDTNFSENIVGSVAADPPSGRYGAKSHRETSLDYPLLDGGLR